jgi:AbrB family looped-hinge helix DNA binding protein
MTLTVSTSLEECKATIGPHGRVVVPAPIRKSLNWKEGTVLTFAVKDGQVVVSDQLAALRRFQDYAQSLIPLETDVLEDFLAERRAEARREAVSGE